jgi:ABC-type nitrate/sulfonate/bicarbonate transport system substrate-binding protein/outer membrane protein OmpA-like peptidoglycan-associated protein
MDNEFEILQVIHEFASAIVMLELKKLIITHSFDIQEVGGMLQRFSKYFVLLTFMCLIVNLAQAAPAYVESLPLSQVLDGTKTGPVKDKSGEIQVPFITWGGDIATILANGDTARTKRGSLFAEQGLKLKLKREDDFAQQVKSYIQGDSPYLRGTVGMINIAAEALSKDPKTNPVIIYQMTWSAGGDALVVKPGIHSVKDLKGKTIALQAYGPHVDYMTKILTDAGLSSTDVKLRWLPDLTGTDNAPMAALQTNDVDAAFVITPDAMVLSSGGTVGTGAEDSVKGARILLSTRTANRIIADVYAVRSDYFKSHRKDVESFTHGLLKGQEALQTLFKNKNAKQKAYQRTISNAAELLLDSTQAIGDVEGLYADAEFVGWQGNVDFFSNPNYPRSLDHLSTEIQHSFQQLGLLEKTQALTQAGWDYDALKSGLNITNSKNAGRFQQQQVAAVVSRRQRQGTLGEGELFSFEIFFKPNQNNFSAELYQDSFSKVVEYASTYGGALITIEGHSDPLGYLRKKKAGQPDVVLGQTKQSAKNLSLSRAVAVRDSIIKFASSNSISLDASQFAVVGHGISKPKSGVCGSDPCAPKSEKAWRDNMRVEFRVLQIEAEESIFSPL